MHMAIVADEYGSTSGLLTTGGPDQKKSLAEISDLIGCVPYTKMNDHTGV